MKLNTYSLMAVSVNKEDVVRMEVVMRVVRLEVVMMAVEKVGVRVGVVVLKGASRETSVGLSCCICCCNISAFLFCSCLARSSRRRGCLSDETRGTEGRLRRGDTFSCCCLRLPVNWLSGSLCRPPKLLETLLDMRVLGRLNEVS